ncbi:MAG: metal ABC transporter substrate-binding protein [Actinomycetaceae bacterium]|nr:metal ABC transporter substrate-binding protein [Actinomycetaceae bacterium]
MTDAVCTKPSNRLRQLLAITAATVLATTAAGCTNNDEDAHALDIKTSFYPLQYLTEEIGGENVQVHSLTPPGTDAHSLELSPKTVTEIGNADAVIYLSHFQSAVDEAVDQAKPAHALDVYETARIQPTGNKDTAANPLAGANDPHFWLDASRMADVATQIGDFLGKVDPDNAANYRQRASEVADQMQALNAEMVSGLSQCERDTFIVSHEAFGYLADQVSLKQVGVSGLDPEVAPSPERLKAISKLVKETGAKTIFTEVNVSPKVIEVLAADLGITTDTLDPIATLNDPKKDYPTLMREDLAALQKGLECKP